MKITLDISENIICGFLNCVELTNSGMQLLSFQISSDDLKEDNVIKLPREVEE